MALSYAPQTSAPYKRTGANKASNKKLHLDIGNLLKSIYLLQANIERLAFSTNFFLEVAKLPFELKTVPRYVYSGALTICLPFKKKENFSRVALRFCFEKLVLSFYVD